MDGNSSTGRSRLAESAYNSPYTRAGAPKPHPNTDPYAPLRSRALSILEAMGYDPKTMFERGVVWAEDQDPFGHVKQSQYVQFLGACAHRFLESYDEFLSEQEYNDVIHAKSIIPVMKKYELNLKRQVKYPDSLIAAYRLDRMEPDRISGTVAVFSLKQQAIVAESTGTAVYVNAKTGRPVDLRKLGGGWPRLYEGFTEKAENARKLKREWESKRLGADTNKSVRTAKI